MASNKKNIEYYSTQSIDKNDIKSVIEVLRSDSLSRGPTIQSFEKELGRICNNKEAITFNSATSALQIAYQINGVGPDSLVWTTPITFAATVNAALLLGARIDFVDIDNASFNICPHLLEEKLVVAKKINAMPNFLIAVHFGGSPCDMRKLHQLSKEYNFKIIEDASHALGAFYKNSPIGQNKYSQASVFSFHPVKMITTGEGGSLLVNTSSLRNKALRLRSHGISPKSSRTKSFFGYEQEEVGYNYRMSEIQAALGLSQLQRLSSFVEKRNKLANLYRNKLQKLPVRQQQILPGCLSSYHLFVIQIMDKKFQRKKLLKFLNSHGIGFQIHYIPLHLQKVFKDMGFKKGAFLNSEKYFKNCVSLPLHPKLNKEAINFISEKLVKFF